MKDPVIDKTKTSQQSTSNSDVSKQYPLDEYNNKSSIAKEIIAGVSPKVWSQHGMDARKLASDGDGYLKNRVISSKGGHSIHMNDHENSLTIIHSEGGGIKYYADGSVDITTPKSMNQEAGSEYSLHVDADGTMTFTGNLKLKVDGDFDVECLNYNVTVAGNKTEDITGSATTTIGQNKTEQITGASSFTYGEASNQLYLGGLETSVKGSMNMNIDGAMAYMASGNATFTSEQVINISANNTTIAANDMTVMGGTGTIGGTSVDFVGNGAVFDRGVTATVFTGNLNGKANSAVNSALTTVSSDTPAVTTPTTQLVSTYLTKAAGGIRKVVIDAGDYLKNFINKSENTGGLSTTPIDTAGKVRGKMRNPSNRTNTSFVPEAQGNGTLCPSYFEKTPALIGRVLNKDDPIVDQDQKKGDVQAYTPLAPKKTVQTITVDTKYNPSLVDPNLINGKTKVGPETSISKFLATDDPVNMNWIKNNEKKASLAKYYYLHAKIMQTIKDNSSEFDNYRLVVSEGLYRPGPKEIVEAGSIADLRRQGRAVVYKLVDMNNNVDLAKTFDLAAYWMHTEKFEKLILDYDTIDCSTDLNAQVIVIYPELTPQEDFADSRTSEWRGDFKRDIETHYNGEKLAQGELVEVKEEQFDPDMGYVEQTRVWKQTGHRYQMDQNLNPPHIAYTGERGKLDPATLVKVQEKSAGGFGQGPILLEKASAARWYKLKAAGQKAGFTMELNAGYRSWYYQYLAYKGMKSADPGAAVAKAGVSRHGTGKAIDLANCDVGSELWKWMKKEGWKPENGGWRQADSDFFKYKDPYHFSDNGH